MTEARLATGSVLQERYEILDVIGEGGFGVVYKAKQISTDQRVAIKILLTEKLEGRDDADIEIARFEREMRLIGTLKHPNIVRLIDSGRLPNGQLYAVLEFIEGTPLNTLLAHAERLEISDVKRVMGQVLEALSAAHAQGTVHRDLKPHNIMVTDTGARKSAMVLDFGIAGIIDTSRGKDYRTLTRTGQLQGTPAYMAPEQVRGEGVTPQTDIYAWGLVFIEALTGAVAVDGDSLFQIIFVQASDQPIALPDSIRSDQLRDILARATAKDLGERFQSAEQALVALEAWSPRPDDVVIIPGQEDRRSIHAARDTTLDSLSMERPRGSRSRNRLLIALALIGLAGVIIALLISQDEETREAEGAERVEATEAPPPPVTEAPAPAPRLPPPSPEPAFAPGERVQPEGTRGAEMVFIPSDSHLLGATEAHLEALLEGCREHLGDDDARCEAAAFADLTPPRRVSIPAFFIDPTEVTLSAYAACIEEGSCDTLDLDACAMLGRRGAWGAGVNDVRQSSPPTSDVTTAQLPVTCVSQVEAARYCDWAGKRLPTELEWEFAALGIPHDLTTNDAEVVFGAPSLYPWEPREVDAAEVVNGADASLAQVMGWRKKKRLPVAEHADRFGFSAPVGQFEAGANPFGVQDLSGNVREWTQSPHVSYRDGSALSERAVTRGGGWADIGPDLSPRTRAPEEGATRRSDLGFRCARSEDIDAIPPVIVPGVNLDARTVAPTPPQRDDTSPELAPTTPAPTPPEITAEPSATQRKAQGYARRARRLMISQPAKAARLFALALELTPDDLKTRNAYAIALERAGELCDAREQYRRIAEASDSEKARSKVEKLSAGCP